MELSEKENVISETINRELIRLHSRLKTQNLSEQERAWVEAEISKMNDALRMMAAVRGVFLAERPNDLRPSGPLDKLTR
jgi:hypothetical protein